MHWIYWSIFIGNIVHDADKGSLPLLLSIYHQIAEMFYACVNEFYAVTLAT